MKSGLILSMAVVLSTGSGLAFANDQALMKSALDRLGQACKERLMTTFPGVPMADLHMTIGASFKESLDNGSRGLEELQKSGAFYQIEVPGKGSGACGVNAQGEIIEFSISKN